MRSSIRPIKSGTSSFKVFFEDLNEEELQCLLFCLNLEKDSLHRIGRGKPYGMGGINIKVEKIILHKYVKADNKITVCNEEVPASKYSLTDDYKIAKNNILKYSTPLKNGEENLVSYPLPKENSGKNSDKIFQWFVNNRGKITKPEIDQVLPKLNSPNKTLKK